MIEYELLLNQSNNFEENEDSTCSNSQIIKNISHLILTNKNVNGNIYEKFHDIYNEFLLSYEINGVDEKIRLLGNNFYENNKENCKMIIDDKELDLIEFYENNKMNGNLVVNLLIKKNLSDFSYMFFDCSCLVSFKFLSELEMNNITNTSFMFYGCTSLSYLDDISTWNMINVADISNMFYGCLSLNSLPDISLWNTKNIKAINHLFYDCTSLIHLPNISKWNTSNIINMSHTFHNCSLLKTLPDLSKWNICNTTNISYMFYGCTSLESLPDLSKWNTSNIHNMEMIFCKCVSLKNLPNISEWNTMNLTNISYMFYKCSSLSSLPDISKWNISNVVDIDCIFCGCSSLTSFPDISNWKQNDNININNLFSGCHSLKISQNILTPNNNGKDEESVNKNKNEKLLEIGYLIRDDDLKILPQIELKFNFENEINNILLQKLREEIKNFLKINDFSIIAIKKGSLKVILALQHIFSKIIKKFKNLNIMNNFKLFNEEQNKEIELFAKKLKDHQFTSMGSKKPIDSKIKIIDLTKECNKKEICSKIDKLRNKKNNNEDEINLFEASKNIKNEDFEKYYDFISFKADEQENNQMRLIEKLDEFNQIFDKEIEYFLNKSIFEYKIIHIFLVDRDKEKYILEKNKCPNRETKILLHGTNIQNATGILSTEFREANVHIIGKGVYFTDMIDYAWFYAGKGRDNSKKIPKVGDTFSAIASEIYYDKKKLETVYNCSKHDESVVKNGIRCAFANYETKIMEKKELSGYNGFIGNEFLITDKNQILPLYVIIFKRVEYLVLWRDYNFNSQNPNKYKDRVFSIMKEFHSKLKKLLLNELNCKIYFVSNDEEGIKLLKLKKYNKVIVVTNGSNGGEDFINKTRKIIKSNPIAAVSAYDVKSHIKWVKDMKNVLILNGIDFHEKFFKSVINNDINSLNNLRKEIIDFYSKDIEDFSLKEFNKDLFNFGSFINDNGKFKDLDFKDSICSIF